jgi:hypothetical protein
MWASWELFAAFADVEDKFEGLQVSIHYLVAYIDRCSQRASDIQLSKSFWGSDAGPLPW